MEQGAAPLETIKKQTAAEIRRLPLTLGKLAGALIAVISLAWAVIITTRRADSGFAEALPQIVAGVLGILVFILFDAACRKHLRRHAQSQPSPKKAVPLNLVSWGILLALAGLFILATLVSTSP